MIKLTDIYLAVKELLIAKYGFSVHGNEVVEGFDKPSFLLEIKPNTLSNSTSMVSPFYRKKDYYIIITYFQASASEIDNLEKVDELEELFGNNIKINDSESINIYDYTYTFVGQNTNILQLSMQTQFYDPIPQKEEHEQATNLTNTTQITKG